MKNVDALRTAAKYIHSLVKPSASELREFCTVSKFMEVLFEFDSAETVFKEYLEWLMVRYADKLDFTDKNLQMICTYFDLPSNPCED